MKTKKNTIPEFPFESQLSFSNIIGFWELRALDKGDASDPVAKEILEKLDKVPELRKPIKDLKIVEKNRELIQWLMTAVLPPALIHDQLVSVVTPFKMEFVHTTKSFDNLMEEIGGVENMVASVDMDEMSRQKAMAAYHSIIEQFYGITVPIAKTIVFPVRQKASDLLKYYKVTITTRFCEISLKGELPKLTEADIQLLLGNPNNLELWKQYLPPKNFLFLGFALYSMIDITEEQVVSLLKESLLRKDSLSDKQNLDNIQEYHGCGQFQ